MYKCIAFVARIHGYTTIKHLVENESNYDIIGIFTHKLNPKSYDPQRKIRNDFKNFENFANLHNIPFFHIDTKEEKSQIEQFVLVNNYDFLLSISWRYIIPPNIFSKSKIGSINIHRGDLPKYAGVEPIKKALLNNEKEIAVSSHIIEETIDSGEILCKQFHPCNYDLDCTLNDNIERLKKEITPYFSELTMKSFKILLEKNHDKK